MIKNLFQAHGCPKESMQKDDKIFEGLYIYFILILFKNKEKRNNKAQVGRCCRLRKYTSHTELDKNSSG